MGKYKAWMRRDGMGESCESKLISTWIPCVTHQDCLSLLSFYGDRASWRLQIVKANTIDPSLLDRNHS